MFSDQNGTFHTTYHTYRDGQPLPKLQQVVDVIITGEVGFVCHITTYLISFR